jgi:hypothetical protein
MNAATQTTYIATDTWSAQPWDLPGEHASPEAALDAAVAQVRESVLAGDYDCDGSEPASGAVTVRIQVDGDWAGSETITIER